MNLKRSSIQSLVGAICLVSVCLYSGLDILPIFSKPIVKDEGQIKLMQEINAGQKFNQLTVKEANKLRKDLAHIARKKAKMLAKTNRKLTDENRSELVSDLNNISNNMYKLELEKRINAESK